ncbi:MAG: patatin-like phospholipase family protein [Euryhalocaulis sp.]|uniref:patatin-like phospholipase family protein n=1 Tax=Euryhalocaulis sp. TaxID=2744307 RepID=UPI0017E92E4D|nr:patatin-like phospholipase family protein [Euryhalocaulis sp.]MBA4801637.1 patatin-like phospholipase family protein [Euryhalocaulis sp.]
MAANGPRPVCLALQGGGAHGAFTWGVLDKLAEDGRLGVAAMSATSAGAVNAAAWASGYHAEGAEGARERMRRVWGQIASTSNVFAPNTMGGPFQRMMFGWMDAFTRLTSPYNLNPLGLNPLRDILEETLDVEGARACADLKLFIAATNVSTGKARIFRKDELTVDAILASACLPFLFQAVEIDGEHYWDGGYTANPALWPFFYEDTPSDIVIVHINPMNRNEGPPTTAADIVNRVNEITFNTSLQAELRAIDFVKKLRREKWLSGDVDKRYRDMRIHSIRADAALSGLGADTKYRTDRGFIEDLFARGRDTAAHWLDECFDRIGKESSIDIRSEYLDR